MKSERFWSHCLTLFLFLIFTNIFVFASPSRTTYQARIVKPNGYPLEALNVSFKFSILDPSGSCILYAETYSSVNMSGSGGLISFALGSGIKTYPASSTTFSDVFSNQTASLSCDAGGPGSYAPVTTDNRKIVMQFNDGAGWQTLPAMSINAVPYAMYAGKSIDSKTLNGKADTEFVENATLAALGCNPSTHAITFNGVSFSCLAVGSGGGVTSVTTSGSVLVTGGTVSAPVISITAATMSQSGYLTSLDYAEFKAKLSASFTQIVNTLGYAPVSSSAVTSQINSSNLSGDVSGTVSSNSVITVGGKSSAQISTSVNETLAATASATVNTIVKRDASGNSSFGGLSANTASLNYVDIYKPSSSFNIRLQAPTSLSANYTLNLPTTSGTTGQVLSTDGSGNLSWINSATGSVTSVSGATNEITSTGGSTPVLGLANTGTIGTYFKVTTDSKGRVTSGAANLTLSDLPASVLSTTSTFSGDIAGMIANITVNRIQGVSVTITSLTTNDILQYDGSKYINKNIPSCSGSQYLTFNGVSFSCFADAGASGTITTLSVTGPISSTGGSNPTLSMAQANTSTNGYLSSIDWNTFNNKQNATSSAIIATLGYTPADSAASGTYLQKSGNLSDLTNAASARTNLGLGTLATANSVDLGSASATGTLAIARLPSFTGDATIAAASNTIILSNSGVNAGTYTKVTVDAKGRVTSSTALTSSDVTTALGYTPANATSATQWTTSGTNIYYTTGNIGVGIINPSAILELASGTASGAPLKFTSGTLLSSAQSGAMEYDGFNFYLTDAANTRRTIATGSSVGTIDNASTINSSGNISMVPVGSVIVSATTVSTDSNTGALVVKGGLGVAGNINTGGNLNVSGSQVIDGTLKLSSMTSGSVLFAGTNGTVTQDNSSFYWDNANKRLGIGTATPSSQLNIGGNISSSAWGSGIAFKTNPATYNDTSSSGTVSTNYVNFFGAPTLTASAATTYTNAATVVINGAPIASTNVTNTNSHALLVSSGQSTFQGNISLGTNLSFAKFTAFGFGGASSNEGIYQLGAAPAVGSATDYIGIKSGISQALTSSNQTGSITGFISLPSANVGAGLTTSEVLGFYALPTKNAATTGTLTNLVGFKSSPLNSSSGIVTNSRGVWITNPTNAGAGSITNSYGLYIDNITTGTNKWSIYSNGGDNYFAGNVGIGVTNPNEKLVVSGGNIIASGVYASGPVLVNPSSGAHMLWYPRKAAFRVGNLTGTAWNEANIGNHSLGIGTDSSAANLRATAIGHASTATGGNDPLAIGTSAYANNGGAAAIGMLSRANGAQSLALGTYATSEVFQETVIGPYNVLSVGNANAWVNTDPLFVVANGLSTGARSNAMTILKNGNVGIGTIAPTTTLHVASAGVIGWNSVIKVETTATNAHPLIMYRHGGADTGYVGFGDGGATNGFGVYNYLNADLTLGTSSTTMMTFKPSGNVGIGTVSPQTKLDVSGEIVAQGRLSLTKYATLSTLSSPTWHIDNNNDQFRIFRQPDLTTPGISNLEITASGSVGIGTTLPTQKLDVSGTVRANSYKMKVYTIGGPAAGAFTLSNANTMADTDLILTVPLKSESTVTCNYNISMSGGGSHLVTSLVYNGVNKTRTISGDTAYWQNTESYTETLAAGTYTIKVQYRSPVGGTSNPSAADWQNRMLQCLVYGD